MFFRGMEQDDTPVRRMIYHLHVAYAAAERVVG